MDTAVKGGTRHFTISEDYVFRRVNSMGAVAEKFVVTQGIRAPREISRLSEG